MKAVKIFAVLVLLLMAVLPVGLSGAALAQDEGSEGSGNVTTPVMSTTTTPPPTTTTTTTPPASMKLTCEFPAAEAIATGTFTFNVVLSYTGDTSRVFDLNATGPSGWDVAVTGQYDTQRISSITIDGSSYSATSKTVKMTVKPQSYPLPDPGDYTITLQAVSGDVVGKIDLTARITAKYVLTVAPYTQLYNTTASAGRDNTYSIVLTNAGTATIDNISFSSDKPDGWEITFKPDKLDLLNTLDQSTVDVDIKPPPKTVAGDYMITLHVSGTQATADKMDVRVTVKTPTIWGWVGVIIIVIVVAGLIVIFMRFGRR
jgi:uncharacterized membrane protein